MVVRPGLGTGVPKKKGDEGIGRDLAWTCETHPPAAGSGADWGGATLISPICRAASFLAAEVEPASMSLSSLSRRLPPPSSAISIYRPRQAARSG